MRLTAYTIAYVMILLIVVVWKSGLWRRNSEKEFMGISRNNTNAWRGLLAVSVVLHHLSISDQYALNDNYSFLVYTPLPDIGCFAVAGFFMFSGYGLMTGTLCEGAKRQVEGFLTKRLSKILPSFLFMIVVAVSFKLIFKGESVRSQLSQFPHYNQLLWYSWFMFVIIYQYVAYYLSLKFAGRQIMLSMLCASVVYYVTAKYILGLWNFWYVTVFAFNVGMAIRIFQEKYASILGGNEFGILKLLPVLIVVTWYMSTELSVFNDSILMMCNYLCFAVLFLAISLFDISKSSMLQFLGAISFEIYLTHGLFIEICSMAGFQLYAAIVLTLLCTISAAYLLHVNFSTGISKIILRLKK